MIYPHVPLEFAEIQVGDRYGRIGIVMCPGRGMRKSSGFTVDRNLDDDLRQIRGWGAALIVSLLERAEIGRLQVPRLGEEIQRHGMHWLLVPIRDSGLPDENSERIWAEHVPGIIRLLRQGRRVLFHCRAGRGRSGMMVARLLIELGWAAEKAIAVVRRARPGALERSAQEAAVRRWGEEIAATRPSDQRAEEGFSLSQMGRMVLEEEERTGIIQTGNFSRAVKSLVREPDRHRLRGAMLVGSPRLGPEDRAPAFTFTIDAARRLLLDNGWRAYRHEDYWVHEACLNWEKDGRSLKSAFLLLLSQKGLISLYGYPDRPHDQMSPSPSGSRANTQMHTTLSGGRVPTRPVR